MKRAICIWPITLAIMGMMLPSFAEVESESAPGGTKIHVRSVNEREEIRFQAEFYAPDSTLIVSIEDGMTPMTLTLSADDFEGRIICTADSALIDILVSYDGGTSSCTTPYAARILKEDHVMRLYLVTRED